MEVYQGSSWSLLSASLPSRLKAHCHLVTSNGLIHLVGGLTLDQDGNETLAENFITIDMMDQSVTTRVKTLEVPRSDHGCIR